MLRAKAPSSACRCSPTAVDGANLFPALNTDNLNQIGLPLLGKLAVDFRYSFPASLPKGSPMKLAVKYSALSDIDPRLLEEAFHRARRAAANQSIDSASLLSAIIAEARLGTRHMHGLVSAAAQLALAAG